MKVEAQFDGLSKRTKQILNSAKIKDEQDVSRSKDISYGSLITISETENWLVDWCVERANELFDYYNFVKHKINVPPSEFIGMKPLTIIRDTTLLINKLA
jgi:hypothetical protein